MSNEERKEYNQKYYQLNKAKIKETNKIYEIKNKEKMNEYREKYRKNNKEKMKEYMKEYKPEYKKTEQYIKSNRISNWKSRGVICDDWNKLYDKYININNCEECNIELISGVFGSNKKCLDHNHTTGEFRKILCNLCNNERWQNV